MQPHAQAELVAPAAPTKASKITIKDFFMAISPPQSRAGLSKSHYESYVNTLRQGNLASGKSGEGFYAAMRLAR